MKNSSMSQSEVKATFGLATIYSMRMLGLFMILPVFSAFADKLQSASPLLIGLGISIYGLTQAIFQIPFGLASDKFGRKRVIGFGLILFILGSVIAAQATSIYMVIAGRALQGSGAIAAATMALLADLTRENQRTKAMAGIGMSIGLAFAVSLVLGPMIASQIGLSGIFWLTAILALLALFILFIIIPNPVRQSVHRDAQTLPSLIKHVTTDPQLLRLDIGIFILHLVMTAGFVVLPVLIINAGMPVVEHWKLYLPTLLVSFAVMVPAIIIAETRNKMKTVFLAAILLVSLSELGFAFFHQSVVTITAAMFVFFAGFNILEATLPSLVSKLAPVESKGTAMGIYSTSQFLGAFCGGTLAGWISGQWNVELLFLLLAFFVLVWLMIASFMKTPKRISSLLWSVNIESPHQARQMTENISSLDGIEEAVIIPEEGVAYLKVNKARLDFDAVEQILGKQVAS
ncbi:MAG: MFS transporter [Gammaproteobacteria bacterium]|nr:MFS transporter [Gammaproteobacteria bacterium]